MGEDFTFKYYYGTEADQYSFYRIPKLLFTDKYFDKISSDAKILYGIMLDRMGLSIKNNWIDEENRVYIIFTINDVREVMRCGEQKAVKLLSELDSTNGIGLIEKKRQGLQKPNLIYVKNFLRSTKIINNEMAESDPFLNCENEEFLNNEKSQFKSCENEEFLNNEKSQFQSCENEEFLNNENQSSRTMKITVPELLKSQSNNTNINDTDISISNPINPSTEECSWGLPEVFVRNDKIGRNDEYHAYGNLIKQNIDYNNLIIDYPKEEIDELLNLMVEVVCSKRKSIRIACADYPFEMIKSKFLKLDTTHIRYVLECLKRTTTRVHNIKSYLLTALFNAPSTINSYYQVTVNHDMKMNEYITYKD